MRILKKYRVLISVFVSSILFTTGCGIFSVRDENRKAPIAEEIEELEYTCYTVDIGSVTTTQYDYIFDSSIKSDSLKFNKKNPIITNVYFSAGDTVKSGDIIMEADSSAEKAEVERLKSEVNTYQAEVYYYSALIDAENDRILVYEKYGIPYKSSTISKYQEALEISTAKLEEAEQSLNVAVASLNRCYIYATDTSTIGYVKSPGVRPLYSSELVATTFIGTNTFETSVIENQNFYVIGNEYIINYEYSANLTNNSGEKEKMKSEGSFPVTCIRIKKEDTPWSTDIFYTIQFEIKDEDYVKIIEKISEDIGVDIETIDEDNVSRYFVIETILDAKEQVLRVPKNMLLTVQNPEDPSNPVDAVFVRNENGLIELRYVKVGLRGDAYVEITNGLSEGEIIIR